MQGIYKITNTATGDSYIGSSIDMAVRWCEHKRSLRREDHHNHRLQKAWNEHGGHNFVHAVLEEVEDTKELLDREQFYIDTFEPFYNVSKTSTFRSDTTTHGDTKDRKRPHLYRVWQNMKTRCFNSKRETYKRYGGRGITVCSEWLAYATFRVWAFENGYDPTLYLMRINVDRNYSPDNCHWSQLYETLKSQKRAMRVTAFGETKLLREWAKDPRCIPKVYTLHYRLISGWKPEDALTTDTRIGKTSPSSKVQDQ